MGEKFAGADQSAEGKRGRGRPPKDSVNETTSGQHTAAAGGKETGSAADQIEIVSGLVDGLGNDQQIPTPGDKPRRGRPPGSTKQTSGTSKKPAGKAKDAEQTKFMVQTLLSVAFNVTSMRAGEHWKLSTAEAEALAEPIAAIMERHDLTEKTGAYGEYIALIAAVGMIIVPKAMMHMDIQKKKGGIRLVQQPKQTTPPASGGTTATSNANASEDERSHQPVQQRDPVYRPSDVKRSLAWIGG